MFFLPEYNVSVYFGTTVQDTNKIKDELVKCLEIVYQKVSSDVHIDICFLPLKEKQMFMSELYPDEEPNNLSYAFPRHRFIIMVLENWQSEGAKITQSTNEDYQLYVTAHEIYHIHGVVHPTDEERDDFIEKYNLLPLMYQATKGIIINDIKIPFNPLKSLQWMPSI